jgi:hypothetical protein
LLLGVIADPGEDRRTSRPQTSSSIHLSKSRWASPRTQPGSDPPRQGTCCAVRRGLPPLSERTGKDIVHRAVVKRGGSLVQKKSLPLQTFQKRLALRDHPIQPP